MYSFLSLSSRSAFYYPSIAVWPEPPVIKPQSYRLICLVICLAATVLAYYSVPAQTADGNNGLSQANTMVRSYFDIGTQLLYAVGALVGLVGAFKVYRSIDAHDGHTKDVMAAWFGACIFLVMAATVLKSFFGV